MLQNKWKYSNSIIGFQIVLDVLSSSTTPPSRLIAAFKHKLCWDRMLEISTRWRLARASSSIWIRSGNFAPNDSGPMVVEDDGDGRTVC